MTITKMTSDQRILSCSHPFAGAYLRLDVTVNLETLLANYTIRSKAEWTSGGADDGDSTGIDERTKR